MKNLNMKRIGGFYFVFILTTILSIAACDSKGQNANSNSSKMTIHEAAFLGNVAELKKHITAKTDLNQKDEYGSAPLNIAAIFNKPEIAELLIKSGADINIKSADGSTPLHNAAFFCRKDIVNTLLENGADISIRNNYGATALESISAPFESLQPVYDQVSRDLGPLGLKLDYEYIEKTRPVIAEMIQNRK